MIKKTPDQKRNNLLRLVAILFICCLAGLLFLGTTLILRQSRDLIGKPDVSLSPIRKLYLEAILILQQDELLQPNNISLDYVLEIRSGQPLDSILADLADNGLVHDQLLFRNLLIFTGADQRILPGKYLIPAGSNMRDLVINLQDINASLIDFTILPGWRKEEIAQALPTSGLSIRMDEFLERVNQPVNYPKEIAVESISHEGFLMPGRYSFSRSVSVEEFINAFLNRFNKNLNDDLSDAYSEQGLTDYQAVILASIVQREAIMDDEKPLIASVFLNRLNSGMPLQTDPTVQYALGFSPDHGWWKSPLSLQDLQIVSAYNTYMINGLPPAPICNPDITSLKAVAYPKKSEFLFFRAACDGSGRHKFAKTMEEHSMNGCSNSGS